MKIVVDLVNTDLTHVLGLSEKGVVIRPLTPQESEQAAFTMDMMLAIVANTIKKIEQSPCNPAVDKVILVTRGNMLGMALLFALSEFVSDLQMIYVDNTTSKFVDLSHFKSLGYEAGMTRFFLTMEENITFYGGNEVATETLAQVAGLAHVDDAVQPVPHDVDARLVRHVVQLGLEIGLFTREGHRER